MYNGMYVYYGNYIYVPFIFTQYTHVPNIYIHIYIYTHIYIMYIVGISHGDMFPIYLNGGLLKSGYPKSPWLSILKWSNFDYCGYPYFRIYIYIWSSSKK